MASRRKRAAAAREAATRPDAYSSPACYAHEFEPEAPPLASGHGFEIKRVYERPERADGYRVLIDRLWPRGLSRRRAALDDWLVDLAPSTALRRWFHRDAARWPEFRARYRAELRAQAHALQTLRRRAARQRVTLLYAARDVHVKHALVLRDLLRRSSRPARPAAS
jgi:uncharacterized protein YeaO (DUF488 family)